MRDVFGRCPPSRVVSRRTHWWIVKSSLWLKRFAQVMPIFFRLLLMMEQMNVLEVHFLEETKTFISPSSYLVFSFVDSRLVTVLDIHVRIPYPEVPKCHVFAVIPNREVAVGLNAVAAIKIANAQQFLLPYDSC
jgi:hypothetical protein